MHSTVAQGPLHFADEVAGQCGGRHRRVPTSRMPRLPDPTIFDAASFVSATPENEWCPLSFRQPADLRRITTHRRMRTERGNFVSSERRRTAAGGFEPGTPVPRPRPTAVISRSNGAMHGDADACRAQCALRSAHAVEVTSTTSRWRRRRGRPARTARAGGDADVAYLPRGFKPTTQEAPVRSLAGRSVHSPPVVRRPQTASSTACRWHSWSTVRSVGLVSVRPSARCVHRGLRLATGGPCAARTPGSHPVVSGRRPLVGVGPGVASGAVAGARRPRPRPLGCARGLRQHHFLLSLALPRAVH